MIFSISWLANVFRRRKADGLALKDCYFNTIKNCIEDLPTDLLELYKYFVLFVEDVNIPVSVLEVLVGKNSFEIERIAQELENRSLLVRPFNKDLNSYVYGIHDLLLANLKQMHTRQELVQLHGSLLDNYLNKAGQNYAKLPNDNYIYTYIGHHLVEAKRFDVFPKIYFDLDFIGAKIRCAGIADLVGDFIRYQKHITNNEVSIDTFLVSLRIVMFFFS